WNVASAYPVLWGRLEDAVETGAPFRDALAVHPFGRPSQTPMRLSARYMPAVGERPAMVLVTMEEADKEAAPESR
ncbi:MAG: hypothetical protein ACYC8T_16880, partial [Myxococcaceae bacterium]